MAKQINDPFGGTWTVYHVSETRCPEIHNTREGEWFFEPCCVGPGRPATTAVYSNAYPTEGAAEQAAMEWAERVKEVSVGLRVY
jgi:hypothetical protein